MLGLHEQEQVSGHQNSYQDKKQGQNVGACVQREADRQALLRHATAIAEQSRESSSAKATASGSPEVIARPLPRCMIRQTVSRFLRVRQHPTSEASHVAS